MAKTHTITCPYCEAKVTIPLYWRLGVEGIFRCKRCKLPFKTGFKTGAILSALALTVAFIALQGIVYLLTIHSMIFFVALLLPSWLWLGYRLRRSYLIYRVRREAEQLPAYEPEQWEQIDELSTLLRAKLPQDTSFDQQDEQWEEQKISQEGE